MSTTRVYWLHHAQGTGGAQEQSTPVGFEGMHRFFVYNRPSDDTVTVYITTANWDDKKIDRMIGQAAVSNPRGTLVAIGTMSVTYGPPEHPREAKGRNQSAKGPVTVRRVVDWCSPHFGLCTTFPWRYKTLELLQAN